MRRRRARRGVTKKSVVKTIKSVLSKQVEHKIENTNFVGSTDLHNLHRSTFAFNMTQGDDHGKRVGSDIYLKGARIFGSFTNTGAASGKRIMIRFALVRDKMPNMALGDAFFDSLGDIQLAVDYDNAGATNPIWLKAPLNPRRFVVYKQWTWTVGRPSWAGETDTKIFSKYFKINKKIKRDNNALVGTSAAAMTPAISLYWWPEIDGEPQAKLGATALTYNYYSQMLYTDM